MAWPRQGLLKQLVVPHRAFPDKKNRRRPRCPAGWFAFSVCFKGHGPHPAKGSEDAPEGVCDAACAKWIVLRGPFGAPQDEGGGLLKQTRKTSAGKDKPNPCPIALEGGRRRNGASSSSTPIP